MDDVQVLVVDTKHRHLKIEYRYRVYEDRDELLSVHPIINIPDRYKRIK